MSPLVNFYETVSDPFGALVNTVTGLGQLLADPKGVWEAMTKDSRTQGNSLGTLMWNLVAGKITADALSKAKNLLPSTKTPSAPTRSPGRIPDGIAVGDEPFSFEPAADFVDTRNPIAGKPRSGSALKTDPHHSFPDLADNFASAAEEFAIPTKGPGGQVTGLSKLYQMEGSLNGKAGVFEYIMDGGKVTHRRFIPGGKVTGIPNQVPGRN